MWDCLLQGDSTHHVLEVSNGIFCKARQQTPTRCSFKVARPRCIRHRKYSDLLAVSMGPIQTVLQLCPVFAGIVHDIHELNLNLVFQGTGASK